jgi:hypothetical protein
MRARLLTVAAELRLDDEMPEPMEADALMNQTGAVTGLPAEDASADADRSGSVWISRPSTIEIPDLTEADGPEEQKA